MNQSLVRFLATDQYPQREWLYFVNWPIVSLPWKTSQPVLPYWISQSFYPFQRSCCNKKCLNFAVSNLQTSPKKLAHDFTQWGQSVYEVVLKLSSWSKRCCLLWFNKIFFFLSIFAITRVGDMVPYFMINDFKIMLFYDFRIFLFLTIKQVLLKRSSKWLYVPTQLFFNKALLILTK